MFDRNKIFGSLEQEIKGVFAKADAELNDELLKLGKEVPERREEKLREAVTATVKQTLEQLV